MKLIITKQTRQIAIQAIIQATDGYLFTLEKESRSKAQNRHIHALFNCFDGYELFGRKLSAQEWKASLFHAFCEVKRQEGVVIGAHGQTVPTADGKGVLIMRASTTELSKSLCAEFIEYLYAYGTEIGIKWTVSEELIFKEYLR